MTTLDAAGVPLPLPNTTVGVCVAFASKRWSVQTADGAHITYGADLTAAMTAMVTILDPTQTHDFTLVVGWTVPYPV